MRKNTQCSYWYTLNAQYKYRSVYYYCYGQLGEHRTPITWNAKWNKNGSTRDIKAEEDWQMKKNVMGIYHNMVCKNKYIWTHKYSSRVDCLNILAFMRWNTIQSPKMIM